MEEKQSYKLGNVFIESKPVSLANPHKDSEEHKTLKIQEFHKWYRDKCTKCKSPNNSFHRIMELSFVVEKCSL